MVHISKFFNHNFLFDSHAHINAKHFDLDREKIVKRALENGVKMILDMSTDLLNTSLSLDLSKTYRGTVFSFVGIDPEIFVPGSGFETLEEIDNDWFKEKKDILRAAIQNNREYIKGIGETGMDYYWIKEKLKNETISLEVYKKSKVNQKKLFLMHLELASEFNLPLSIHSRDAEEECINIVKDFPNVTGIFHSFAGNFDTAKNILDLGYGLGVNGIFTFKNAYERRGLYKKILGKISDDWNYSDFYQKGIFFETDCPFLAPEGKRGQRNEPSYVRGIYENFVGTLKED